MSSMSIQGMQSHYYYILCLHSCLQLEDEPLLEISLMGAIGGNQSLKHTNVHATSQEDPHQFHSSYHLLEGQVDVFKHDIKPRVDKSKGV